MIPAGLYKRRTPPQGAVSLPPHLSLPLWGSLRDAQTCLPPAKRGGGVAAGGIVTEQRNNPSGVFHASSPCTGEPNRPAHRRRAGACSRRIGCGDTSSGEINSPPSPAGEGEGAVCEKRLQLSPVLPSAKKGFPREAFFHISILLRFCRFQTDPCRSFRSARCRFPRR